MAHKNLRCIRCGVLMIVKVTVGPNKKYCNKCIKQVQKEKMHAQIEQRKEHRKMRDDIISKYKYDNFKFDNRGRSFIDHTHCGADVFITEYGKVENIGTITEWELDKHIFKLRQTLKDTNEKN